MKTSKLPFFFVLILSTIIIQTILVQANPALDITVKTDKQKYYAKDIVQVYGNLTLDGVLVTEGLVGIQIQTPQDRLLTIRTIPANNPPSEIPYVMLEYVAPCDSDGNPKFSFPRGQLAYFKISVANLDIQKREALMAINIYYNDNTPFGYATIQTNLTAKSTSIFITSIPIPVDAVLGTATAYANAYTDWPKLAGTPYYIEVNASFQITNSGGGAAGQTTPQFNTLQINETNNFNLTFGLPRRSLRGNYTVYATSRYFGESVFNSTTFEVYILGDLGGGLPPQFFAFDGKVDGKDLSLFLQCFRGTGPCTDS